MRVPVSYHLRRLGSRLHRMRIALAVRGWTGLLRRVLGVPAASGATSPQGSAPLAFEPLAPAPSRDGKPLRWLLIDVSTPRPDRDSGSLRSVNLMRLLRADGHAVDFLPDDRIAAGHYADLLRGLGVTVHDGGDRAAYPRWFDRHLAGYDVLVVSRYHLAEFLLPLARLAAPATRVVLDTVDLHHVRERREAEVRGDDRLRRLSLATRARELATIAAADVAWVVSAAERDLLARELPDARVALLPNIVEPVADPAGPASREGLLFVGGARHPPNVDAIEWLVSEIFPRVRERLPGCTLHLVGDGLSRLQALRAPGPGVVVHDHVPDLAPLLAHCRVGLAPLRYGAGVKGKVNQYMAHGLAVVATPGAAEGAFLQHERDVLLADDAPGLAAAAVRACTDAALWQRLVDHGLHNTRHHFSFGTARRALADTLELLR
ncbi:glycosyltransferase family 4 protein [Luteimonas kalidii]|uniref:Glycosyltransferase family 4 protein n=1 Tax=Luteimonas kalidii TaxID=3042025 RepID=A0ABT6JQY1_9GAMM|nr:glycosyltransferase family 4 protein [Luteimonas kalidii]MDH5833094.1 glycosyltransferase family 4 protein [Luteimonas kalidii]